MPSLHCLNRQLRKICPLASFLGQAPKMEEPYSPEQSLLLASGLPSSPQTECLCGVTRKHCFQGSKHHFQKIPADASMSLTRKHASTDLSYPISPNSLLPQKREGRECRSKYGLYHAPKQP